ncbi:MAG: RNA-binding protein [Gammaproteobacteria bacterium]|nr:RNA-binding protein [Gammaproteobacteria bacterium]
MRIDRWLWWTRFYKTRGLASEAVKGGHIKLDGERCKAAKTVAIGDRLSITKGEDTWHVIVAALPSRRGPASEAQACFTETAESLERRLARRSQQRADVATAPTSGRPDRRTRRLMRVRRGRG